MPSIFCQKKLSFFVLLYFLPGIAPYANAQEKVLTLKDAIHSALADYGIIKAKKNQLNFYRSSLSAEKAAQIPDFNISAQQDYGTVNGQTGPSYSYRGLSVSSSGPALLKQNYNAAFGALYLSNINWDIFSFGKVRNQIRIAGRREDQAGADLEQEQFEDEVKVSSDYLNLLASTQLEKAQFSNLQRAIAIQQVVRSRVLAGLNPGVDSSLAGADVSSARIALTNIRETEAEQRAELATITGSLSRNYIIDTAFIQKIPAVVDSTEILGVSSHPVLTYYEKSLEINDAQVRYLRSLQYPTLSVFSVFQGKGSGFKPTYGNASLSAFSHSYSNGVNPTVSNYLIGVGLIWNISSLVRTGRLIDAQRYEGAALKNSYDQVQNQLDNQLILSTSRIKNAWRNYREAPVEVKAATEAYRQKTVLYANGLATIVDLSTALYTLNRAETDQQIAYNNIWQALLYRAAAKGDFQTFYNLL